MWTTVGRDKVDVGVVEVLLVTTGLLLVGERVVVMLEGVDDVEVLTGVMDVVGPFVGDITVEVLDVGASVPAVLSKH